MGKKDKLVARLKSKPKDFTFDEVETLLLSMGFQMSNKGRTSGSRVEFMLGDIKIQIHRPHPRKEFYMYQINNLLKALADGGLI